jgi:hypothetical protein
MQKATYELQRLDIFQHLNGKNYQVEEVKWIGGDSYRIDCLDADGKEISFPADVHTSFQMVMTYSKAGA